jgi:hypothetical protein
MTAILALFGIGAVFKLLFMLIAAVVGLAVFAFWIWMLVHAITNKGLGDTEKIIWVLVIIFLHFLGALIYFFVARPKGVGGIG